MIERCKIRFEGKGKGKGYADEAGKGFADESSKGTVYGTPGDNDPDAALRRALQATKGFGPKDWEVIPS